MSGMRANEQRPALRGRDSSYRNEGGHKRSPLYKRLGPENPHEKMALAENHWPGVVLQAPLGSPEEFGVNPFDLASPPPAAPFTGSSGASDGELARNGGNSAQNKAEGAAIAPWLVDETTPTSSPVAPAVPPKHLEMGSPSRKQSLHDLSRFGAPALAKLTRQTSAVPPAASGSSAQLRLPVMPVPSASGDRPTGTARHGSESLAASSHRDKLRNGSEESFMHFAGAGGQRHRDASLPPTKQRHTSASSSNERDLQRAAREASVTSTESKDKKRGFGAFTGLLKRKGTASTATLARMEESNTSEGNAFDQRSNTLSSTRTASGAIRNGSAPPTTSSHTSAATGIESGRADASSSKLSLGKSGRKASRRGPDGDYAASGPISDPMAQEFSLDLDLDHMEGIVDLRAVQAQSNGQQGPRGQSTSSSGSGGESRKGGSTTTAGPTGSSASTSSQPNDLLNTRRVTHTADNIPHNPFTRQNPFSTSLDRGDGKGSRQLTSVTPPSPHSRFGKSQLPPTVGHPRRPSQLRKSSAFVGDEEYADRISQEPVERSRGAIQAGMFRDPFTQEAAGVPTSAASASNSLAPLDYDVEPNGALPSMTDGPFSPGSQVPDRPILDTQGPEGDPNGAAWTAPESWGVEVDELPAEPHSSDDDDGIGTLLEERKPSEDGPASPTTPRGSGPPPFGARASNARKAKPRPGTGRSSTARPGTATRAGVRPSTAGSTQASGQPYSLRIYGADGSWVSMGFLASTTTQDMLNILASKGQINKGGYKMYIRERGQDRLLQASEKPVAIQLRRFLQAGYNESDSLEGLGKGNFAMLCRFLCQPPVIPVIDPEDENSYESFELMDLGGRDLQAVPIFLYRHAETIISLNLSRNPLSDLPLDFIQACVMLRELRMTHMALKRVPNSIRHSSTLTRLDISCNRIPDLEHAGLSEISTLVSLKVQNNRLTTLPTSFSQLRSLKYLNISNNKLVKVPEAICDMVTLVDLDVSFNDISALPSELCKLTMLERFVAVSNSLVTFPESFAAMESLQNLDVRRNLLTDLDAVYKLPNLAILQADNNNLVALDAGLGAKVKEFAVPHNSISRFALAGHSSPTMTYSLTSLDLSYGKLSTLADDALEQLIHLEHLNLNYNQFVRLPSTMGSLRSLKTLSCTDNVLTSLPDGLGELQQLEVLNVHNNNLKELPSALWFCKAIAVINVSSNLLEALPEPPGPPSMESSRLLAEPMRKDSIVSNGSDATGRLQYPAAISMRKLYLGDNRLTDDIFDLISKLTDLRVLNISFNDIYEIPAWTLSKNTALEELYLSGNHLTMLPSEDLEKLLNLKVLHLNGNKLQTLPAELGKIRNLVTLDVGSNVLKYNIANWPYDWNWNWNLELRYLNLSGNKRLEIKPSTQHEMHVSGNQRRDLSDFSKLSQLRVLGLMDVTLRIPSLPDETEDRRVRTSFSEINNMAYGIADALGRTDTLSMFDLVIPNFRGRENECLFGMFGRAHSTNSGGRVPKHVQEWFMQGLTKELDSLRDDESPPDALRRTFLAVNKDCYEFLSSGDGRRKGSVASGISTNTLTGQTNAFSPNASIFKSGAAGAVAYLVDRTLHVANAGDILAVVSHAGEAELMSVKHDPIDREETLRIRAAEAWVSPRGLVNDEIDISRGFGFYNAIPAVNALPDILTRTLTEADEFVIIGNRALWDYCSYQTAVDIARTERDDPMMAAQKLRDFAISYGAQGSTMIMVISIRDLFYPRISRNRPQAPTDMEQEAYFTAKRTNRRRADDVVGDRTLMRLQQEVEPPTGQVALVFTDIKNSTSLWETNAGMQTAMRLHNNLLRRQLRIIGGYEVKTEGDSFMVSFPTVTSAMLWCFTCQIQLLNEDWPREILECDDGRELLDAYGDRIARGLSVRMGIHWGIPVWEKDPITRRMDYFGPMVNKAARINASADGGQIMASSDVLKEVQGLYDYLETEEDDEVERLPGDVGRDVTQLRRLGLGVLDMGERKLKGLELPERLFLVYPKALGGRLEMSAQLRENVEVNSARVFGGEDRLISLEEVKQLVVLCVRLEALSQGKVFGDYAVPHAMPVNDNATPHQAAVTHAAYSLGPTVSAEMTDEDLVAVIDSLTIRIENALSTMYLKQAGDLTAVLRALQDMTRASPAGLLKAMSAFTAAVKHL